MTSPRVQIAAAAAWVGLCVLALAAPSALPGGGALLYLLVPLAVGVLVGRWPAVALALVPALLSLPLGRNGASGPFHQLVLDTAPWLAVPILIGVAAAKLARMVILRGPGRGPAPQGVPEPS